MAPRVFYFRKVGLCLENGFFLFMCELERGRGGGLATKDEQLSIKTYWGGGGVKPHNIQKSEKVSPFSIWTDKRRAHFQYFINISISTWGLTTHAFAYFYAIAYPQMSVADQESQSQISSQPPPICCPWTFLMNFHAGIVCCLSANTM